MFSIRATKTVCRGQHIFFMLYRHFEPDDKPNSLDSLEDGVSAAPNENQKARLRDTKTYILG